jgi:hypothetical protein
MKSAEFRPGSHRLYLGLCGEELRFAMISSRKFIDRGCDCHYSIDSLLLESR